MWQNNKYLLLFTLVNLVHPIISTGPFTPQLSEVQMEGFQSDCSIRINTQLHRFAFGIEQSRRTKIKFIQPCEKCLLLNVKFNKTPEKDVNYRSEYDGNALDTIFTTRLGHYEAECDCTFDMNAHAVEEAFITESQKHWNETCTQLISKDTINTFKSEDVEKCFEMVNQQKKAKARVKFTGGNVHVTSTVRYNSIDNKHKLIHRKIEINEVPQATCQSDPKNDVQVIKACECLDKSKVFHSFPRMMASQLLSCHPEFKVVHYHTKLKSLSCEELYLWAIEDED